MKQIDIDKQLATMRARIAELERKNREQAAIIRLKDEHIADLLKDRDFNNSFIERLLGILEVVYSGGNHTEEIDKKPKPTKSKIVKLNPQPLSGHSWPHRGGLLSRDGHGRHDRQLQPI